MRDDADANERLRVKVPDAGLRARIAVGGAERHTVIVEVEAPSPRVAARIDSRSGRRQIVPDASDGGDAAAARAAAALGDLLDKLTGERPPYLSAARAYVVDATADQIHTLVASPLVRSVQPNRRRAR